MMRILHVSLSHLFSFVLILLSTILLHAVELSIFENAFYNFFILSLDMLFPMI